MQIRFHLLVALAVPLLLGACATHAPQPDPVAPVPAGASPPPVPTTAAAQAAPGRSVSAGELVERTQRSARSTAEWLARGVDSWFGDKPFSEGGAVTDGRLSLGIFKRQDESIDFSLRFNARFRLPNLEEKTYFFIGRDNEREVVTDKPGALSRQDQLLTDRADDRSFFAGIGRSLNELVDFRVGFRGGLKPYVQARYRRPWEIGDDGLAEFRQTVFYTVDDKLGSTTALSYEHLFDRNLALRWLNAATITQENRRFDYSSSLGAYRAFGDLRLLSLELLASGRQGTGVKISDYGVQAKWEQPLYRTSLIGEVSVGHFWPRRDTVQPRGEAWAVGTRLKLRF